MAEKRAHEKWNEFERTGSVDAYLSYRNELIAPQQHAPERRPHGEL